MDDALPRPQKYTNVLWWCCGFGSGESGAEKSLVRWPSWFQRGRQPGDSEVEGNWWWKNWNSVKRASEWSESATDDVGRCCGGSKWKRFVRRFKIEGRSICRSRPPRFQYDPLSYALNFDQGSPLEPDYPSQHFSARFAASTSNPSEDGDALSRS